ncbi:MAG: hypothetical protein HETSPECPRED_009295 [Heterodermia speciosa]|uniref:Apple domain-containing protein n=1 Tax=Heterodermia speciosa TaxID=116794 RepID=A0A8H3G118_9LECA|nr:MAG: hypothetical protein HETSPECPRED_009295 [Heterodermia speciosa]
MRFYIYTVAALASSAFASPVQDVNARNLTPAQCSKVCGIVDVLKLHKATPFCSSFLSLKPTTSTSTIKVTSTATTTSLSTVTSGTASTSVVFKPGNPPSNAPRAAQPAILNHRQEANPVLPLVAMVKRDQKPSLPSYVTAYATAAISSACSCLSLATPTTTVKTTSTGTVTSTITSITTVSPPVVTSTEYPCATPIPSLIPTIPYGNSNQAGVIESSNELFGFDTPGATLEGCCNLCYFGTTNCIQAYYYFYEGCVIQQATSVNATGEGISNSCPNGQISGLTYSDDTSPPFRSTGTIAGPCGQVYNNL